MLKPEDFEVTLDMHRSTIELEVRVELVAKSQVLIGEETHESLPDVTNDLVRQVLRKIYGHSEKDYRKWQAIVREAIGLNKAAHDAFDSLIIANVPDPTLIAKRIRNKEPRT